MSNPPKLPSPSWIILAIISLVSLYAWKQPFQADLPVSSQPIADSGQDDLPPKLYEAGSRKPNKQTVSQTGQETTEKPLEIPNAPSFPAFKTSADHLSSRLYNPYPDYNSQRWRQRWKGSHTPCLGPRGVDVNGNPADMLKGYKQEAAHGSPEPIFGSYLETSLDARFCFDRFARFSPYGYDEDTAGENAKAKREENIDWAKVDWAKLQNDCLSNNQDRYESIERGPHAQFWMPTEEELADIDSTLHFPTEPSKPGRWSSAASFKKRSAVVLHRIAGHEWSVDTTQYIRSIIQELSLHSGAEYEVIILVEIENNAKPLFTDSNVYSTLLDESVPNEFKGNALLFSRALFDKWYPKVGKHSDFPNVDITQGLQLLSLLRPDIEYFWQFETDARYTGHHYQHFETVSAWSKAQPRRLLWERSSRYFVPAVHGNWSAFSKLIEKEATNEEIWGPARTQGIEPIGPDPPVESPELDKYEWGVEEEADLITTAPIVDATDNAFSDEILNYPAGIAQTPSRMSSPNIMTRFSKRLLRAMHHGQLAYGTYMPSNRFFVSTALHHGLKAVAFPLPIYLDYAKAPVDVDREVNTNNGRDIYNAAQKFEEIGHRMTCFSPNDKLSNFADELYKRWLGYGRDAKEKLCLPGVLLHSVKGV